MNEFKDVKASDLQNAIAENKAASSSLTDEEQQLAANSKYRSLIVQDINSERSQQNTLLAIEKQKQANAEYYDSIFPRFDTLTEQPMQVVEEQQQKLKFETGNKQIAEGAANFQERFNIQPDYQKLITDHVARERVASVFDAVAAEGKSVEEWDSIFKQAQIIGTEPSFVLRANSEDQAKINQLVKQKSFKIEDIDTPITLDIFANATVTALASDSINNFQLIEDRVKRQKLFTEQQKQLRTQSNNIYDNFRYGQLQLETLMQAGAYWLIDQIDTNTFNQRQRDWQLVSMAQQVEDSPHDLRLGKLVEEYDKNGLNAALSYAVNNGSMVTSILAQAMPSILASGPVGKVGTAAVGKVVEGRIANLTLKNYLSKASTLSTIGGISTASMAYQPNVIQGYEKTGDPTQALDRAQIQTSVDSAIGALGGLAPLPTMFFKGLSSRAGNVLNILSESTVQSAAGGYGAYYSAKAVGDEVSEGEILLNTVMGFITTPVDLLVASAASGKNFDFTTRSNLDTANSVIQQFIDMPVTKRNPELTAEIMGNIIEQADSPVKSILLPVELFNRYFQEQGIDPVTLAEKTTGETGALEKALVTGEDLAMPIERYSAFIAAQGHHEVFANELKTAANEMSARELAEFDNNIREQTEHLTKQVNEAVQKGASFLQDSRVYNDVYGQLIGIGTDRATAEKQAIIYGAMFNTLAERSALNMDAMALYDRYKLQIKRNLPDVLTQARTSDNIDLLINRLRNGDIPSETAARGKTLFQRIKELGGIKDKGGELASRDIDTGKKGKARITNNKTGKSLDEIATELAREGYLFDQENNLADIAEMDKRYTGVDLVNILLDRIDAEARGEAQYSPLSINDDLFSIRQQLTELSDLVERQGIDLNSLTNQEVKDLLLKETKRYSQKGKKTRGFIDIAKDGSVRINLTENANLSTFLHETGHFFLNVIGDIEALPEAGPEVKQLADTFKKWLNAKDLQNLTVAQHEKFARGFEAYLFEGKAPSAELQGAFARFKAWLTQVYKVIKNLNVKLNDDVRRAFDRMLATDDAIEVAKAPYDELFSTPEQMGVTAEEFNVYRETAEKASIEAKDKLLSDSLKEITRETESWWNDEKAKLREQVATEVNSQPVYRVQDYLRKGLQSDGTQAEAVKLNRELLINRYGKGIVRDLKGLTAKDGVNPESVAMMHGFSSSDEMVKALQSAPDRNALINAETDARMRDIYGDMLNDGSIAERAITALHESPNREKVIRAELAAAEKLRQAADKVANIRDKADRAASRQALDSIPTSTMLRDVARRTIGDTKLTNINPYVYLQAGRKANKEALAYARKNDWQNVSIAKQKELINHFLYLEAEKAREAEAKIFNYFRKFDKKATRERIGKAGGEHLEQIDALLADYEIKRVSNKAIARRKSLASYVAEQQRQGNIVAIDQALIDNSNLVNYRELTYEQLQALRDAVKNIETIATLKNKLRSAQGERDYQATKDAIIEQLNATVKVNARQRSLSKNSRKAGEKLKDWGAWADASLIRMEHLISNLDGGDVNGIFHQLFWNPLADAAAKEKAMFQADMLDLMKLADKLEGLNDTHYINSLGRSFATRELIMIALNTGNESNKAKLLKGGIDGLNLQPAQLADILAPLTKDKWDFVQEVWTKFDNRWPDIAAMYKRITGVEPKAVEATPINTQYGEYKGGYFPIIYDRSRPNAPDAFLGGELFNGDFEGAMPSNGFTNARNENVTGPLKLEIESISQHMMMQIHDLTHREALQNAYRLAKDRDVRNALIKKLGPEQADLFIKWLKNIANDANPSGGGVGSQLINAVRNNTSIVGLGFSTTTMLAQFGGVVPVIRYAGAKDFAGGLIQLMRQPLEMPRFIMEKSPAMQMRWDTTKSSIDASFDRLRGKNNFFRQKEKVVRFAFDLLNYIDRYVTGAGWLAAYNRALKEGKSEAVAIHAGDTVVRKSQGGFNSMDKAAIQYGDDGKVMAMFTMFYTPFSAFYNQGRDLHFEVKNGVTSKSKAAAIILATAFFQGVVGDLLTGQGPDDDENLAAWMGKSTLGFATSGLPIVRDVVSSWTGGRVYSMSPLAQSINKVTNIPRTVKGIAEGKEGKTKQAIEATGLILGVPVKPLTRQGDALYQIAIDEYNPEDASGFVKALIYGVRKKDKE